MTTMDKLLIAAGTRIVADAGIAMAQAGGNAVDAAIAAAIVSMCTDTGIMSPGSGAFIVVWPPDAEPAVIDGYVEMPGRGLPPGRFGQAMREVVFDYGGEMRSGVGFGAVATPGAFAGLASASEHYGTLPWGQLLAPAIEWVARGFPLTGGAAEYLRYTHAAIYSWHPDSYRILHHEDGSPLSEGDIVRIPYLADTLTELAEEGAGALYGGELGERIANGVQANGGLLGNDDLRAYREITREPVTVLLDGWTVATNPPPAVGGACLTGMLTVLEQLGTAHNADEEARHMVAAQHAVLDYRRRHMDGAHQNLPDKVRQLLDGTDDVMLSAPSTTHISTVDASGCACAITASGGYGSGAMVDGTGFWLNNSLGELDLHPRGLQGLPVGSRLTSNMAPTIARREDGAVLAIGSPGASRITTAIAQVLWNFVARDMPLEAAVRHPRLHVESFPEQRTIACEPGLGVTAMRGLTPRPFTAPSMYFGGVQAALWTPDGGFDGVADARRGGSVAVA